MSLNLNRTLPIVIGGRVGFGKHRPDDGGWSETAAAALAVADVTSIKLDSRTVRTVVAETIRRYGGVEHVHAELSRRLAGSGREAHRTRRTLTWARDVLSSLDQDAAR